ncbi:hypothetical protein EBO15_10065 [Actinomadura harenae]|uniref:Uncharacterized protein n=1 Tax=Actinomadura harenae TaxID=2483351 RepID=A0A3M2M9J3_9ACTN|nr:hypothetical protein EBO15_10065 [Actinomadura harenae]
MAFGAGWGVRTTGMGGAVVVGAGLLLGWVSAGGRWPRPLVVAAAPRIGVLRWRGTALLAVGRRVGGAVALMGVVAGPLDAASVVSCRPVEVTSVSWSGVRATGSTGVR